MSVSNGSAVSNFVEKAKSYCNIIEEAGQYDLIDRCRQIAQSLAAVYLAGFSLPNVEPSSEKTEKLSVPVPAQWPGMGRFEYYWLVYNPYERDGVVGNSLSDDLLDVYKDLKRGMTIYERGTKDSVMDAIWTWRFDFLTHWGVHATNALKVLHWIIGRHNGDQ